MLTHRNLLLMVLSLCTDLYPFSHRDIGLHVAPLSHGSGLYALPLIAQGEPRLFWGQATLSLNEFLSL